MAEDSSGFSIPCSVIGLQQTERRAKMYTFDARIRYSETDSEGRLTLEGLLDYFQDCSTFHSEELGLGVEYLRQNNLVWVLSKWQIVVNCFPRLCDRVTVGTFPYHFKGCFGYRNFFMRDEEGRMLACADSLWTLLDTERFKPVYLKEEMLEKYALEEKLPMAYDSHRIQSRGEGHFEEDIIVRPHHLDINHHVNNGQYVRMARGFLPEGFSIGQMRAEYRRQALLHDVLHPFILRQRSAEGNELWVISLQDENGGVYVNVEFEEKKRESGIV